MLILSLLYLIYLVLTYIGLVRYISMYTTSLDSYIDNYSDIEKIRPERIVVSLFANKDNIDTVLPTVKSLLDQTTKVSLIYLVLDYGVKYDKELEKVVSVIKKSTDYGKLNSLIPVIMKEGEADTIIVTLGPGKVYGIDFLETILNKFENKVVCCSNKIELDSGAVFRNNFFTSTFLDSIDKTGKCLEDFFGKEKVVVNYTKNYTCFDKKEI